VAAIKVIQGPDKGLTFELRAGENVIGRQDSSIVLRDGTVSRHHAKLVSHNGQWVLEDLGSANGTYLNGAKLTRPTTLNLGDRIRCGTTLLLLTYESPSAAEATENIDEVGRLVDAAIVATIPSGEDSIIIPTPEAGAQAIGNLRILYDLITEVSSIFNVEALLERTLDKIFEVVKADRGYVMLFEKTAEGETGKLKLKASRLRTEQLDQQTPISRTIINEVLSKQVGVLSSNAMSDRRFTSGKSVHDFGIRSAICVPLKGRGRILGIIHVDCGVTEQTYSTEQLRLLTAIGYQTGLAIENVLLHDSAVQSERLAAAGQTAVFLSHHTKNILQALQGGTDVVETALQRKDLAKALNAWPIVQRNLGRINELILNMLAFSKDHQPLLENININHVLTECIESATPEADRRGIAILEDLGELPEIAADAAGMQQAFANLLNNALDVVEDNAGTITVSSRYDSENRNVTVRIMDNGGGIPKEQLDHIFTPFWSAKGQKGTGLGLAVAQKVFYEHAGKIEVESNPGEGTTFTVTLPALHAEEPDTETETAASR